MCVVVDDEALKSRVRVGYDVLHNAGMALVSLQSRLMPISSLLNAAQDQETFTVDNGTISLAESSGNDSRTTRGNFSAFTKPNRKVVTHIIIRQVSFFREKMKKRLYTAFLFLG